MNVLHMNQIEFDSAAKNYPFSIKCNSKYAQLMILGLLGILKNKQIVLVDFPSQGYYVFLRP